LKEWNMASPRINISVDEDLYSVLSELSDLRQESMSSIIYTMLDERRERMALQVAKLKVARRDQSKAEKAVDRLL
jgi:predicted CopG family antitoxin